MRALNAGVLGFLVTSGAGAATGNAVVHQFPAPNSGGAVQMSGTGDGENWFAEPNADSLAMIRPDGSITEIRLAAGSRPLAIARGRSAQGNLAFTLVGTNRIGVMNPDGDVTEYDIPTPASHPRGIVHSTVTWFTEYDGNRIGRLDILAATPIQEFPIPTFASGPLGITTGPGVAFGTTDVWFTEYLANKIGRIDASGTITEYPIPTPDSGPTSITSAVIGNELFVYFLESTANKIGRIDAAGQITEYRIPTPNSSPADIVGDWDGVWFSERAGGAIGWLSGDGEFREFRLPGGARPEGLALDDSDGYLQPSSVWFLDGTRRRIGRLSDNHIFAVGAGHGATWDTEFELTNAGAYPARVELGFPYMGVCPGICPATSITVDVPRNETVEASASQVPVSDGVQLHYLTAVEPQIDDVPETHAWIVDAARPELRLDLPLVSYWTVATLQPPLKTGTNGPQPFLTFPARRRAGVRTDLVLAGIEPHAGGSGEVSVLIQAIDAGGDVVASLPMELPALESIVLDKVLSELGIFTDFDGHLRVRRVSRSGLFWGVAELFENGELTRILAPGSELEPECSGGPARCGPPRRTRVVTREGPTP